MNNNYAKKLQEAKKVAQLRKLSKMDEIQEALDMAMYLGEDAFTEAMDEAESKMVLARDIMRFDFNEQRGTAEELINEMREALDSIEMEYPSELENAISTLEELENIENKNRDKFGSWSPMF